MLLTQWCNQHHRPMPDSIVSSQMSTESHVIVLFVFMLLIYDIRVMGVSCGYLKFATHMYVATQHPTICRAMKFALHI